MNISEVLDSVKNGKISVKEAKKLLSLYSIEEIDKAKDQAKELIANYVSDAHEAPWPDVSDAFTDVQDVGSPAEGAN